MSKELDFVFDKLKNATDMILKIANVLSASSNCSLKNGNDYISVAVDLYCAGCRIISEGSVVLDGQEYQDYCAYKIIAPQIKGCLDRERELEKQLAELKAKFKS